MSDGPAKLAVESAMLPATLWSDLAGEGLRSAAGRLTEATCTGSGFT